MGGGVYVDRVEPFGWAFDGDSVGGTKGVTRSEGVNVFFLSEISEISERGEVAISCCFRLLGLH